MSPTSLEVGIVFDTEPKSDLALSDPSLSVSLLTIAVGAVFLSVVHSTWNSGDCARASKERP